MAQEEPKSSTNTNTLETSPDQEQKHQPPATKIQSFNDDRTQHAGIDKDDDIGSENEEDMLQEMDEQQLEEYKEMLDQLGNFADKVLINTLSMIAEDYSIQFPKSCSSVYSSIRSLLLSRSIRPDCKLPLVYLLDSILKNVKGLYLDMMRKDIKEWMEIVYDMLSNDEMARMKLRKVWNTWREFQIFPDAEWREMGRCFLDADAKVKAAKMVADAKAKAAGIERRADGTLNLSLALRKKMQMVLDDVQADGVVEELDKVSLDRLAEINPSLLVEIKKAAEELLSSEGATDGIAGGSSGGHGGGANVGGSGDHANNAMEGSRGLDSAFMETRSTEEIKCSREWEKLGLDHLEKSRDIINKLQHHVRVETSSNSSQVVSDEASALDVTQLLGSASATASHLANMLERLKVQQSNGGIMAGLNNNILPGYNSSNTSASRQYSKGVDKEKFTTEGVKEKNEAVIARLYDVGLPFVSSSDGRRFASQIELSKHLDELFRKSQLEKTMERSEEREWYSSDLVWTGQVTNSGSTAAVDSSTSNNGKFGHGAAKDGSSSIEEENDPKLSTVPADELRDRCVICGINFTMHFDQEEGEWKYSNCQEIDVLNDDAAEKESEAMLVHATCLRGLGSPDFLTIEQVLQGS